jgi:hypothetical protein
MATEPWPTSGPNVSKLARVTMRGLFTRKPRKPAWLSAFVLACRRVLSPLVNPAEAEVACSNHAGRTCARLLLAEFRRGFAG